MADKKLRFGVGDGKQLMASTWNLVVEDFNDGSEIYLFNRTLGHRLKCSLHKSGNWHFAYDKKTFNEKVKPVSEHKKERFVEKWVKPNEIAKGVTLAVRIVTPHSSVTKTSFTIKKKISWIPIPPYSKAIEIYFIITTPKYKASQWPGYGEMKTSLVGSLDLVGGNKIWVVYKVINKPKYPTQKLKFNFVKGKTKEDLKSADALRMLTFDLNDDGSAIFHDLYLKPK